VTRRRHAGECGSLTVEVVLLTPVLAILAMFMVFCGRVTLARQQVVSAARAGAESSTVAASPSDAEWAANATAVVGYEYRDHTCEKASVLTDVSQFHPGGSVVVTVDCLVNLSDLSLPGIPRSVTVQASVTGPIDPYRSVQ